MQGEKVFEFMGLETCEGTKRFAYSGEKSSDREDPSFDIFWTYGENSITERAHHAAVQSGIGAPSPGAGPRPRLRQRGL